MSAKKNTTLKNDLLNGTPKDFGSFKPVYIAQSLLKNANKSESDVNTIEKELFQVFEDWKSHHGIAPVRVSLLSAYDPPTIEKSTPWACAGWLVEDPIDLFIDLKQKKYLPILDLINKYNERILICTLILHSAKEHSDNENIFMSYLPPQSRVTVHKGITELYINHFAYEYDKIIEASFKAIYPSILQQAEKQARKKMAQKGGLKKNELARILKEKAIELFNKGHFRSKRNGAFAITEDVQAFGREHLGFYLTTDDPRKKVYDWILEANKQGLIKTSK